jgi:hypothetical protein
MALHTLGTAATTSLTAVQWWPAVVAGAAGTNQISLADVAAMSESVSSPELIAAIITTTGPNGILFTASTHANTTLDTLAANTGGALATIQPGSLILGVGIPAGTFVVARTPATGLPTSLTLSQAATTTALGVRIIVAPPGPRSALDPAGQSLILPQGRGRVRLFPGDYIAISNTGWPIVLSSAEISYTGSLWSFV